MSRRMGLSAMVSMRVEGGGEGASVPRVLHVLGALDRGGIEMWILHLLRKIPRSDLQQDLLLVGSRRGDLEPLARESGAEVYWIPIQKNRLSFLSRLYFFLRDTQPDILHSHLHYASGLVLSVARAAGIGVRVAHSHTDTRGKDSRSSLIRRAYIQGSRLLLRWNSTDMVAASPVAAECLFPSEDRGNRLRIIECGIDITRFRRPRGLKWSDVTSRRRLSLGTVGRLVEEKNHSFLLDVFAEVLKARPEARLSIVGDGPLKSCLQEKARLLGLSQSVTFWGPRDDICEYLLNEIDIFVFPSLHEGLGLAVIEAQASGLPCVISDGVPPEAVIVEGNVRRLPLEASAEKWAEEILALTREFPIPHEEAYSLVESSPYNIDNSSSAFLKYYRSLIRRQGVG